MRPTPSRFPILRPPPLRLVVVTMLALLVGVGVHRTTASASEVRARLGSTTVIAVARNPLEPGAEIRAGDIDMVDRPTAHLPETAIRIDPTGRTVRAEVMAGEVVVEDRLAGADRPGAVGLVPEGWRALAIPVVGAPLPASPGDIVDLVASFDPTLVERDPSFVVAADAVVIDIDADALTVAVPRSRLTQVVFGLANGVVHVALVG